MKTEDRNPKCDENSTTPSIAPSAKGFAVPADKGGTIPTGYTSGGAKIPTSYGPKGAPVIEP